jgi:hypothetical protein
VNLLGWFLHFRLVVEGLAWGRAQNALAYSTTNLLLATLRLRDQGVLSQHSRSSPYLAQMKKPQPILG